MSLRALLPYEAHAMPTHTIIITVTTIILHNFLLSKWASTLFPKPLFFPLVLSLLINLPSECG